MKTILSIFMVLCMATNLQACSPDDSPGTGTENNNNNGNNNANNNGNNNGNGDNGNNDNGDNGGDDNGNNPPTADMKIKITFGDKVLTATLTPNATSRAFVEKLPVTLPMLDLYSREMCYRFPDALPANEAATRGYEVGEIIYYPPRHSFVIMYAQNGERFQMQTIGRVDSNVEAFRNIGDIDVRFELAATKE